MARVLIPYRGDRTTARLNYKKLEKKQLKRWKRKLLRVWDLKPVELWDDGYKNDDIRKALGIEKNFLQSTNNLENFGVKLKPEISPDAIINLEEDNKDYLRNKCLNIFIKYGKTIKVAYAGPSQYDYKIFKDGVETDFEGAEDEQLATLLYSRLIMYMVDNDSTDTVDRWSDVNPNEFDYWTTFDKTEERHSGGETYTVSVDARSQLKYFKYTFTSEDILKVVNDRLFTKRRYLTYLAKNIDDMNSYAYTIDTDLLNELLDNSDFEKQVLNKSSYLAWNSTTEKYEIDYEAVKSLPPKEFMFFIQAHLTTFHKVKKKWYQSGIFGFIVIIIAVVVAYHTGQWQLVGAALGVAGALLGNEVIMIGGMMISLVGSAQTVAASTAATNAAAEQSVRELARAGMSQEVIQEATNQIMFNAITSNTYSVGKFMFNTYQSFSSLNPTNQVMPEAQTPNEVTKISFIAEDEQWDSIWQLMPEYVMASTMKIM